MIPDGSHRAVVDRIEDGLAVLEVTGPEDELHELVVSSDDLPSEGRHADAIFTVGVEEEQLVEATYQQAETHQQKERAQRRFDQLSSRPPDSDDEE
jgi:hypothetical protein